MHAKRDVVLFLTTQTLRRMESWKKKQTLKGWLFVLNSIPGTYFSQTGNPLHTNNIKTEYKTGEATKKKDTKANPFTPFVLIYSSYFSFKKESTFFMFDITRLNSILIYFAYL